MVVLLWENMDVRGCACPPFFPVSLFCSPATPRVLLSQPTLFRHTCRFASNTLPPPPDSLHTHTHTHSLIHTCKASKLRGLGAIKSITSFYDQSILLHINDAPLVVTLVGMPDVNVGALREMTPGLKAAVEPLRTISDSITGDRE